MKKLALLCGVIVLIGMFAGCTMTDQGTATGAILGGATGAVIGNQTGHKAEGALIGGVVGAIAGHAIGEANQKAAASSSTPQVIVKCPYCKSNIDVTGIPSGSQIRCPKCNNVFTY